MLEKEMNHFLNDLSTGKINRQYLQRNEWDEVKQEDLAFYFVSLRKHFNSVKKIIQFVSGSIILLQNSSTAKEEVYKSFSIARNLLDELKEAVFSTSVPKPLMSHHKYMVQSIKSLEKVFNDHKLLDRIVYVQKAEIETILRCLKHANHFLKKASSFPLGLEMVDLSSGCGCAH